jgi:hypothetical protein
MKNIDVKEMEAFTRIAQARIKSVYCFAPQRKAVAARMYREWLEKKNELKA